MTKNVQNSQRKQTQTGERSPNDGLPGIAEGDDGSTVNGQQPPGLFITDLDGTLFRSDRTASATDLETLEQLGEKGVVRAVATGRSLYSFKRAVGDTLPVDYVIFSTGAGIVEYPRGTLLRKINLEPETVKHTRQTLMDDGMGFMIHRPVPDNHEFAYWGLDENDSDFVRRRELYRQFCWPLGQIDGFREAAQFLVVVTHSQAQPTIDSLRTKLPELNIVRTTSPLDGKSTWIEFFHKQVSKSQAAAWLASRLEIPVEKTLSIGNDYNDTDLLEWSGTSYVVDNAPDDLKKRFPSVASHDECGVTEAVNRWLSAILR